MGSLSDRIGRANLLVFGLLVTGVCTLSMAFATSLWPFLLLYWGLGLADGIMITVIVALVRDFTPRLGRAAAMGFWTVSPVGGSFLATFKPFWVGSIRLTILLFLLCACSTTTSNQTTSAQSLADAFFPILVAQLWRGRQCKRNCSAGERLRSQDWNVHICFQ